MLTLNANVTFFTVNVNGSSNPSLPLPTFQASTHISVSIKPKPGFPIHTFPFPSPGVSHSLPHIPIHTFPSTHSHSRRGFPFPSTHISRARFAASRRSEGAGLARGMRVEVGALPPTDGGRGGGAETTKINSTRTLPNWVKPLKHRVRATGAHAVGKRKQRVCNGGSNAYATEEATRMQRKPKLAKTP